MIKKTFLFSTKQTQQIFFDKVVIVSSSQKIIFITRYFHNSLFLLSLTRSHSISFILFEWKIIRFAIVFSSSFSSVWVCFGNNILWNYFYPPSSPSFFYFFAFQDFGRIFLKKSNMTDWRGEHRGYFDEHWWWYYSGFRDSENGIASCQK